MDNDKLIKYAVKITVDAGGNLDSGSGVIVSSSNASSYYIATAKHVIKECNNPDSIKIEHFHNLVSEVTFKCVDIITVDIKKILNENDGVAILVIDKNEKSYNYLSKLNAMGFVNEEKFNSCVVIGYPSIHENIKEEVYPSKYEKSVGEGNSGYEVFSEKQFNVYGRGEQECLEGLSGSGVFIQDRSGAYHVSGIQIQYAKPRNLTCIDISVVAEEINNKLKKRGLSPIKLTNFSYFETLEIKQEELDLNILKSKLSSTCENYSEDEINTLRKKVDEDMKRLADSYLYRGIVLHENGDNRRAVHRFKNAEKYNPHHRIYFLEAKNTRNKNDVKYMENALHESSTMTDSEQVELLKSLISDNKKMAQ